MGMKKDERKYKGKVEELVLRVCEWLVCLCEYVYPLRFYSSNCIFEEQQGHSINS